MEQVERMMHNLTKPPPQMMVMTVEIMRCCAAGADAESTDGQNRRDQKPHLWNLPIGDREFLVTKTI